MKTLICQNLLLLYKRKPIMLITFLFLLLGVTHASILMQFPDQDMVNFSGYLFISLGGIIVHDTFARLIGWISGILPMLLFLYHLMDITGYDLFILTRVKSRFRWWTAKYLSMICFVVLYALGYAFLHIIVGIFCFPVKGGWGSFVQDHLSFIMNLDSSAFSILAIVLAHFIFGMIALSALVLLGSMIFRNSFVYYVLFTIAMLVFVELFVQGSLIRELSPLNYPSVIDLIQIGQGLTPILYSLIFNVMISLACLIVGFAFVRKRNFS